jgi:hypothetical protein
MIELLVAHLADQGLSLSDYPEALAQIFAYIVKDGFRTSIAFSDYYDPKLCVRGTDLMQIWDPVNHENMQGGTTQRVGMRSSPLPRTPVMPLILLCMRLQKVRPSVTGGRYSGPHLTHDHDNDIHNQSYIHHHARTIDRVEGSG